MFVNKAYYLFNTNSLMKTDERLKYKLEFYAKFQEKCDKLVAQGRNIMVVGDVNTAYEDCDLWNYQV